MLVLCRHQVFLDAHLQLNFYTYQNTLVAGLDLAGLYELVLIVFQNKSTHKLGLAVVVWHNILHIHPAALIEKKGLRELADHFRASIRGRTSVSPSYRPPNAVPWELLLQK